MTVVGVRERFTPIERHQLQMSLLHCKRQTGARHILANYYRWQGIRTGIDLVESLLEDRTPEEAISAAREIMLGDYYRRLVGE